MNQTQDNNIYNKNFIFDMDSVYGKDSKRLGSEGEVFKSDKMFGDFYQTSSMKENNKSWSSFSDLAAIKDVEENE